LPTSVALGGQNTPAYRASPKDPAHGIPEVNVSVANYKIDLARTTHQCYMAKSSISRFPSRFAVTIGKAGLGSDAFLTTDRLQDERAVHESRPAQDVTRRYIAWMAHRRGSTSLPLCLQLLAQSGRGPTEAESSEKACSPRPLWTCPQCGGPMVLIERLSTMELDGYLRPFPPAYNHDSIFLIIAANRVSRRRDALQHYISRLPAFHTPRNSKYKARRFHHGFLQVAVSKTFRRWVVLRPSIYSAPGSRYSTKTYHS